jgi:hypothetical protein
VLHINHQSLADLAHGEAVARFKQLKHGAVVLGIRPRASPALSRSVLAAPVASEPCRMPSLVLSLSVDAAKVPSKSSR